MTLTRGRRHALRAARAVPLAAVLALGMLPAAADVEQPEDLGRPSTEQLARSVQVWDPAGSVKTWDLERTVKGLVVEEVDDGESVLTLTSDLLFAFGSADLAPAGGAAIGQAVAALPQGAQVSVSGHTDSVGSDAVNQPLSEQRAQAVAGVIAQARPDLVLTVEGFGASRPVADNSSGGEDNPEGRALNRRVEVRYAG